jgi:hypothetical protein
MTRLVVPMAALAFAVIAADGRPRAGTSQEAAGTMAVAVAVTGGDGRIIRGLTADQFQVRIDDQPADVVACIEGADLAISLLIDASGSMPGLLPNEVREMARTLASNLRARDVGSVGWFGARVVVGSTFGRERAVFEQAARDLERDRREPYGPSPIWDAMNATLTALQSQPARRVLVIWTDGRASGNLVPFDVVMRHALAAGVTTSFIVPGMPSPRPANARPAPPRKSSRGRPQPPEPDVVMPWERPRLLAEATGGVAAGLGLPQERPSLRLRSLIEGLQAEYILRIRPGALDGQFHPIDITVKAPEFTVRAPASVLAK